MTLVSDETSPALFYDDDNSSANYCEMRHFQLLHFVTGCSARPTQYPYNAIGFQQYMQANSIENFTANEIVMPQYPDRLPSYEAFHDPLLGKCLLTARWTWPRLVCPIALLQMARKKTGPIRIRYVFRPPEYNENCGSKSKRSDHVFVCAADVEFSSRSDLMVALRRVIMPRWRIPEYGLSVGYHRSRGAKLHLGVWAPQTKAKGPRIWLYPLD